MDSNVVRADFGSGLICFGLKQIQNVLCERRGTHALALKHAAPRLRRLRLGLQTRAGHGPDGAHTKRCACPAVEKFCWASSADPPTLHALLLEMGNQCRKTTLVAHFRVSTLQFCAEPQDLRKSTRVCRVVIGWRPRWRIKFSLERFSDQSDICLRIQPLFALSTAGNGQPVSKNDTGCPFQRLYAAVLRGAARSTEVHACLPSCHRMAPTLANQILARTFFRFRLASVCVPSRWKVLSGEFRRRPTALAIKFRKPDRVGRRGLSEPREDFSRLPTYAWTQIWFVQILAAD